MAHTNPGDLVFDGFAGSGATGLAATLCGNPDPDLRDSVEELLGDLNWAPRNGILYDISQLATFISGTLLNPPDAAAFVKSAEEMLATLEDEFGWMYEAVDEEGGNGSIRHSLWTDYPICPHCGVISSFWDVAVTSAPPAFHSDARCPECQNTFEVARAERLTEEYWDDLLNKICTRRVREPMVVYGRSGRSLWKKEVTKDELETLGRIQETPIPSCVPIVPMMRSTKDRWGELHRSGYHSGITHLHHFYTRRNLIAVAAAWQEAGKYPDHIRSALRFLISSYNGPHSTLMTRVVAKNKAKDFVVTGAQSTTLYISSLPVEKNVFAGIRYKLRSIAEAFRAVEKQQNTVSIRCASSLDVDLAEASVDYIFTDPPFGNNIQYSEVNFINEAWLGKNTDAAEEVIVSNHQGKSVEDYQSLLAGALAEDFRILKPGRFATVAFHSTSPSVWEALRNAWSLAGFQLVRVSILDKKQGSFKQVTTKGAVKGDALILLQKPLNDLSSSVDGYPKKSVTEPRDPWDVIRERLVELGKVDLDEARTRQRLYSYLVTYYLEHGQPLPLNASKFFAGLEERFTRQEDSYYLEQLPSVT
jgi:16S rRNA G966 N2-methylase RsmD